MDNVITFVPKEVKDDRSIEERIYDCFHANMAYDEMHTKTCQYCIHNFATSQMLFDILTKDMTQSAKNKNITLCTWDLRQVLSNVLQLINRAESDILQEKSTKEARKNIRIETVRGIERGSSETEETSDFSSEGITEIKPPRFDGSED